MGNYDISIELFDIPTRDSFKLFTIYCLLFYKANKNITRDKLLKIPFRVSFHMLKPFTFETFGKAFKWSGLLYVKSIFNQFSSCKVARNNFFRYVVIQIFISRQIGQSSSPRTLPLIQCQRTKVITFSTPHVSLSTISVICL